MKDQWRIVYDFCSSDFGGSWKYILQRRKKFLWWEYWSYVYDNDNVKDVEERRNYILREEAKRFKVIKEWN